MVKAVFPPCCLTWGQTMVGVVKMMVTSFNRSHAHTATLITPNPAACHCRPTPLPETPGDSQASLDQSLIGSLLLSPGPDAHKVLFVPSKCLFPQSYVNSVIKSHWRLKSNSLGVLSPFARFPGWKIS